MIQRRRVRDLTLVKLEGSTLVIACDSAGGIGNKPDDKLNVPGEILGSMIAGVPLMEVMASGATPVALVNTLSVEMHPTGSSIILGIQQVVQEAGLPLSMINGSTEENITTKQTGVGITVIGTVTAEELRLGTSKPGDLVYCVGKPLVGEEALRFEKQAVRVSTVCKLLKFPGVHEVLPVGSKGIGYELNQLAGLVGAGIKMLDSASVLDMEKSAGPATCILISTGDQFQQSIITALNIPVIPIAKLT